MLEAVLVLVVFIVLDVLAYLYGSDSVEGVKSDKPVRVPAWF